MNLVDGAVIDTKECDKVLNDLTQRITRTLSSGVLSSEMVLSACDRLAAKLDIEAYRSILVELGLDDQTAQRYLMQAKQLFRKEYLHARLRRELGEQYADAQALSPMDRAMPVTEQIRPLGVLLHIAAGNADALPAFTVVEGLLAGNINLLKLPELDGGISVRILQELIREEPLLAPYIYVFDYSSKDLSAMEKLIAAADAVVVWGGDAAVASLRRLVPPNTKLIEWGHKVSFAYVTRQGMAEGALTELARHICRTNQLLCSSCQGIYLDTEDMEAVHRFCERFLPILENAACETLLNVGIGLQAQITLQLYSEELEAAYKQSRVFRSEHTSIIAYPESCLEPGMQFRNCWVRPLPQNRLLEVLRPHKNHLQTVALLCSPKEHAPLAETFAKTGAVRVTSPQQMSESYCGAAHDGEYPLRRYTKVFSCEP